MGEVKRTVFSLHCFHSASDRLLAVSDSIRYSVYSNLNLVIHSLQCGFGCNYGMDKKVLR